MRPATGLRRLFEHPSPGLYKRSSGHPCRRGGVWRYPRMAGRRVQRCPTRSGAGRKRWSESAPGGPVAHDARRPPRWQWSAASDRPDSFGARMVLEGATGFGPVCIFGQFRAYGPVSAAFSCVPSADRSRRTRRRGPARRARRRCLSSSWSSPRRWVHRRRCCSGRWHGRAREDRGPTGDRWRGMAAVRGRFAMGFVNQRAPVCGRLGTWSQIRCLRGVSAWSPIPGRRSRRCCAAASRLRIPAWRVSSGQELVTNAADYGRLMQLDDPGTRMIRDCCWETPAAPVPWLRRSLLARPPNRTCRVVILTVGGSPARTRYGSPRTSGGAGPVNTRRGKPSGRPPPARLQVSDLAEFTDTLEVFFGRPTGPRAAGVATVPRLGCRTRAGFADPQRMNCRCRSAPS